MAKIQVSSKTAYSVSLYLSELDTNWQGGIRTMKWFLQAGQVPSDSEYDYNLTSYISGNPSNSEVVTINGLSPSTKYYILCKVYRYSTSTHLADITGDVTTNSETSTTWKVTSKNIGTLSSDYVEPFEIGSYTLKRFMLVFASSGDAEFFTSGNLDTVGYLSISANYNSTEGVPTDIHKSDDNSGSGNNFNFTYSVSSGVTYYLFVRCSSKTGSGDTTLFISPPKAPSINKWDWEASNGSATAEQTISAKKHHQ